MNAMFLLCILLLVAGAIVVSGCTQQETGTGGSEDGADSTGSGQAGGTDEQEIARGPPLPPE